MNFLGNLGESPKDAVPVCHRRPPVATPDAGEGGRILRMSADVARIGLRSQGGMIAISLGCRVTERAGVAKWYCVCFPSKRSWVQFPSPAPVPKESEMTWRDLVNEQQKAAIKSDQKNTCVIAGPGTGKTRTLLLKAVQLIEDEAATSERIRIVNFTNQGVVDLKSKITTEPNYAPISEDKTSTFHSLALRALSQVSGTTVQRPVVILDDWEERCFVDQYAKSALGLKDVRKARRIRRDFDARWCIASEDIDEWLSEQSRRQFEEVYRALKGVLGLTTRGELTFLWWRYLRSLADPSPSTLGVDCDYLLVDEYQDLNECEHDILKVLSDNGISIFAVGDPNQSIYENLRHAHPEYCWDFPVRVGEADLHILDVSYRCPRRVLEMAQALMGSADGIPDPQNSDRYGDAQILKFTSGVAEVNGISRIAQRFLERAPDSRVLIAVPTRNHAAPFSETLNSFGVSVSDIPVVNEVSLNCRMAKALIRLSKQSNNSVAAATLIVLNCAPSTQNSRARDLMLLAYERSERVATLLAGDYLPPGPLGRAISEARGMLTALRNADDPAAVLADITGCIDLSLLVDGDPGEPPDPESLELERGGVSIRTAYSCKGLQADVVFVPSVEPGSYERDNVGARREESRRVLFVGITRAIDRVFVSYAGQRTGTVRYQDVTGASMRKGPSEFIQDICDRSDFVPISGTDFIAEFLGS